MVGILRQLADAPGFAREAQCSLGVMLMSQGAEELGVRLEDGGELGMGGRSPKTDEGQAYLVKATEQGHAYAMNALGHIQRVREEYEESAEWFHKGAEARLPSAMYHYAVALDQGKGPAGPDYPAAAEWYRQAAEAGDGSAAFNLCNMYTTGRGVAGKKKEAMRWRRKAADNGHAKSCCILGLDMYADRPHARDLGHVEEAAGMATSAGVGEGNDVPPEVLASVMYWLRRGPHPPLGVLEQCRKHALEGAQYCCNDGCQVVGHLKDFKLCPQCMAVRYCRAWTLVTLVHFSAQP